MMKNLIVLSLCAFFLVSTGATLLQHEDVTRNNLWSSWMLGINMIWLPFLFAYLIVGFGAWTLQRLYRKEE